MLPCCPIESFLEYTLITPNLDPYDSNFYLQIPSELGNLFNCTDLFLNNNKLVGKVPSNILVFPVVDLSLRRSTPRLAKGGL